MPFSFRKILQTFYCMLLTCIAVSSNLPAAIINVGPPPTAIQPFIDSASPGDTIQLSAGTYIEEIHVISKNLNIVGAGQNSTTIQAPSAATHLTQNFTFGSNFYCIIMVDNQAAPTPQTVNISDLTVDGSTQQDTIIAPIYGSSDRFFAIGYHNAGGTIENVHTTNTRQTANFNELAGGGIINASSNGAVTFNITNCLVDFYQRQGIDCRGATLTAHISGSTIDRGYVLTPNTATATPNGIQYSGAATGSIINSTIRSNIATVFNASATGLIPFGAGADLLINGNTIENNDLGIAAIQNGNNLTITDNTVNFTTTPGVNPPEGIVVQDTTGVTTISGNIMNDIPFINMELISSTNQIFNLANNQFIGSQKGMVVTGNTTVGPIVSMDSDLFSGTSGFYIEKITSPNDIWPTTASVSFDGLISGFMTLAEFNQVLTQIYDQHNDPALGLVLDYIPQTAPQPPVVHSVIRKNRFLNKIHYKLEARWDPSPSPDVYLYRIYKNGRLVKEIPSNGPLKFSVCLKSYQEAKKYKLVAVNTNNMESTPIRLG